MRTCIKHYYFECLHVYYNMPTYIIFNIALRFWTKRGNIGFTTNCFFLNLLKYSTFMIVSGRELDALAILGILLLIIIEETKKNSNKTVNWIYLLLTFFTSKCLIRIARYNVVNALPVKYRLTYKLYQNNRTPLLFSY